MPTAFCSATTNVAGHLPASRLSGARSLAAAFTAACASRGDSVAIRSGDQEVSYAALEHQALVKEGTRTEDIDQANAQVTKASALIKGSRANGLDVKRRQQDVMAKEADIARERAQIALINSQLNDTTAVSPIAGVVLVKSVDVGEVIAPGTTVVTVGDMEHPWLRAYINEQDLGKVRLGSKAKVTTDAFPGKVYNGKVSFISSDAEFTPKQIQTTEERVKLVYRVKIEIENPNGELKSNMPADAEILLDK